MKIYVTKTCYEKQFYRVTCTEHCSQINLHSCDKICKKFIINSNFRSRKYDEFKKFYVIKTKEKIVSS